MEADYVIADNSKEGEWRRKISFLMLSQVTHCPLV